MTLPEPLARKRDAMEKEYGEDEQVLGPYRDGFDACHEILAEENENLLDALKKTNRLLFFSLLEDAVERWPVGCRAQIETNDALIDALSGKEKGKTK